MVAEASVPRCQPTPRAAAAALLGLIVCVQACSHRTPYIDSGQLSSDTALLANTALRILLIGDAGAEGDASLQLLGTRARAHSGATVAVFLGDNAYPEGLTPHYYDDASARLEKQLGAIGDAATAIFLPGNHDWADGGYGGLDAVRAQEAFVQQRRARFLPRAGCPGPAVLDLPESAPLVRLIALDTQWWLHDGPRDERACAHRHPDDIAAALTSALATDLSIVVAAHHPLWSHGRHAGFYDWRAHLFPLTHAAPWLWIPLPGIGSLYPILRRHVIHRDQDVFAKGNQAMRDTLSRALQARTRTRPVFYAAGHEHSLQVLQSDVVDYILVSGAGSESKLTGVTHGPDTIFAHEHTGFMMLDVTPDMLRLAVVEPTAGGASAGSDVFSMKIRYDRERHSSTAIDTQ